MPRLDKYRIVIFDHNSFIIFHKERQCKSLSKFLYLNACHVVKKSNIAQGKTNSVTSSRNDI